MNIRSIKKVLTSKLKVTKRQGLLSEDEVLDLVKRNVDKDCWSIEIGNISDKDDFIPYCNNIMSYICNSFSEDEREMYGISRVPVITECEDGRRVIKVVKENGK